jgi:hypothetical protein
MLSPLDSVRLHAKREAAVRTLRGEVWAKLESPKRSGSVQAYLVVKRPDALRMRAYRTFAGTIFDMAIRKNRIEFYVVEEEKVFIQKLGEGEDRGEESRDGERKGPDLDALFGSTGLARLILGTEVGEEISFRYVETSEDGLQLGVVNAAGIVEGYVWLEPYSKFKVRQVVLGRGGKVELDLVFGDYREHEKTGLWWPRIIGINAPRKEFRMEMKFSMDDLDFNERVDNGVFSLDVPDDVERVERK